MVAGGVRSGTMILMIVVGLLPAMGGIAAAQPVTLTREIPPDIPSDVRKQIERLHSSNPARRARASRSLGEMGAKAAPAVPFLVELLNDREVAKSFGDRMLDVLSPLGGSGIGVWDEARRALVRIGAFSVEPLVTALHDERPRVRKHAALTLGGIKHPRAVDPLINALQDRDVEVRMWAAKALGDIGNSRAVEPLLSAMKDEDPNVRQYALTALGAIRDWRAIEPLIEELKKAPPSPWAATALFEITGERLGEDPQKWQEWWDRNRAAYEKPQNEK